MHITQSLLRIKSLICLFLLAGYAEVFAQGVQKPIPKLVKYKSNGTVLSVRYGYQEYLPVAL